MSRTPKSSDTQKRAFALSARNEAHLQNLVRETRRDLTQMINTELEYVRGFGLPRQFLRRLEAEAQRSRCTLRDEVKTRLSTVASALPPALAAPTAFPNETKQTSANLYGPNDAYLLSLAVNEKRSLNEVLNRELEFAQDYDLPPPLLARLHAAAGAKNVSLREFVFEVLLLAALAAPEVPIEEPRPKRGRRES